MKAAVLINDDFLGSWLNHLNTIFKNDEVDVIVVDSTKKSFLQKALFFFNNLIFGKPKLLIESEVKCNTVFLSKTNLNKILKSYDIIYNTTSLIFGKRDRVYDFSICGISNLKHAIIFGTVNKQDKVVVSLTDKSTVIENSLRLHPYSLSINTDLILSTFLSLVLLESKKKNRAKENNHKSYQVYAPKSTEYAKYVSRVFAKFLDKILYNEQWTIGYDRYLEKNRINEKSMRKLIPPKDRFWADPFAVSEKGNVYLFIEELIYKQKKAHLSVIELFPNGTHSSPRTILEKPYHLSYPFIFQHEGKYYMIPESSAHGDVQLYEALNFPFEWRLKKVLLDNIKASDTTLLKHNGKWWLFTSVKKLQYGTYDNNLMVFFTNDILNGEWQEHKKNPVKLGILDSRQGGGFIKNKEGIYRVSQNCSKRYGYGFNLSRITELSENEFNEEKIYNYTPNSSEKLKGVHTYNVLNKDFVVFDMLVKTRKF